MLGNGREYGISRSCSWVIVIRCLFGFAAWLLRFRYRVSVVASLRVFQGTPWKSEVGVEIGGRDRNIGGNGFGWWQPGMKDKKFIVA